MIPDDPIEDQVKAFLESPIVSVRVVDWQNSIYGYGTHCVITDNNDNGRGVKAPSLEARLNVVLRKLAHRIEEVAEGDAVSIAALALIARKIRM